MQQNPGVGGVSIPLQVKRENKQLKRLSQAPLVLPKELPPKEDPDTVQHDGEQLQGELGLWWGQQ